MDTHAPKTHLSQALGLSTEEQKARYDALAKELLGDKQVLAHIMQGAVAEFRDMEIPDIVQCIENTDHVDAVCNRLLHKVLDSIIGVGAVAQHVLAAEQHLQLLVGQLLAQDAQTLPGVLIEEADAAIKGSAAPALDREVRDLIHFGQDGTHLIHRHTGGQQRLVSITQDDFRNLDRLFGHGCHLFLSSQFMETRTSPELTVSPLLTLTEATVPS